MIIEDRLNLLRYTVDREPHIKLKDEVCESCERRVCVAVCPAGCFREEQQKLNFSYVGCLECGSCRIACDKNAIEWHYPKGGFGVCYRLM
jgi:ferredoxin like protein